MSSRTGMSDLIDRLTRYVEDDRCSCTSPDTHITKLEELRDEMGAIESLASLFKILGEQNRLRILSLLKNQAYCSCELEFILQLSQPTITHHLQKLQEFGLIRLVKNGRWTLAELAKPKLIDHIEDLREFAN